MCPGPSAVKFEIGMNEGLNIFVNHASDCIKKGGSSVNDSIIFSALINNLFDIEYISNGYYYTYDDTWSNPGEVVTLDGAGYYPQATRNFLFGVSLKF